MEDTWKDNIKTDRRKWGVNWIHLARDESIIVV